VVGPKVFDVLINLADLIKDVSVMSGATDMSPLHQLGTVGDEMAVLFLLSGSLSVLSSQYITHPSCNCFWLFKQAVCSALLLVLDKAGSSMAARIAMMAMNHQQFQ